MMPNTFELPLAFDGHVARLVVRHLPDGGWRVGTEIDGRVLGWEQFTRRVQVDHFHSRMQRWLAQAQADESRLAAPA